MKPQQLHRLVRLAALSTALLVLFAACFNPVGSDPDDGGGDTPPALSSDADLASLAMTPDPLGELSFSAGTTSYAVNVPNSIDSVAVTATASHAEATVAITADGAAVGQGADIALAVGDTEVKIVVTAEDETTKAYTLTITRAAPDSTDSSLASLVVGTQDVALTGPGAYGVTVENAVDEVTITPTASDSQAGITVEVGGGSAQPADSGTAFGPIPLEVGETVVEIVVTAGDDSTSTYELTITRELPAYVITFMPNGGTGSMDDQEITEGETEALTANAFTRLGHSFTGWDEDNNGKVDYADEADFTMGSEDVTLRAVWTPNDYQVVFDKNNPEATGT
ncbi:MAG: cadherin-like beta sandwich domain-containing protein, partial [bacterium]